MVLRYRRPTFHQRPPHNTPANLNLIIRGPHLHLVEHLETPTLVAVKQTHPLDPGGRGIGAEVLGSCNGLLAVFFVPEEIAIWNPYTRNHRVLPSSGINFHTLDSVTYGFGYDSLHDDYKLIRMAQLYLRNAGTFRSEVKVYGLKSNSWRRIRDFPYYLRFKRSYGYLASEALHWVVGRKHEDDEEDVVVAFDLRSEEYREVELPDYGGVGNKRVGVNVDDLGGKLCMVCNFIWERVDVWVMKEYGVKESWSRVASVTQRMIGGGFNAFNPLVYLESRDRILLHVDGSALVWVDLKTKTAKRVRVRDCPPCFDVWKATPSLVVIDAGAGNDGTMLGTAGKINQGSKKDRKKRDDFLSKGFRLVL